VQDVWHDTYSDAPVDGSAWMTGGDPSRRVLRGGSWNNSLPFLRSAERDWYKPSYRIYITGFRIARTI
jgi:formylglycine-generating enzyme required for sulfatase activity